MASSTVTLSKQKLQKQKTNYLVTLVDNCKRKRKALKSNSGMPEFISEGYYSDPFLAERISENKI